jgi:hypothetical protein
MKIAITQKQIKIGDILYDSLNPNWYNLFPKHVIVPIPNIPNITIDSAVDLIILASDQVAYDGTLSELMCFNWAVKNNKSLLAIGQSALYVNYLHNGINIPIDGHDNKKHTVLMDGKIYPINSTHDLGIYELGPRLEQMAIASDKSIEGFKHRFRPFWGVLWNPEQLPYMVLPAELLQILNN